MTRSSPPEHRKTPETSSVHAVSPNELESLPVALGLRYWDSLRSTRRYPSRDEITPRDMIAFLRNVVLIRIDRSNNDYEYRIAGDAHVEALGLNFRGMRLSEIEAAAPQEARTTRATYEHVRNSAEPFAVRGWIGRDVPSSRFAYHESLFMPLGPNETLVDHLFVVSAYVPRAKD